MARVAYTRAARRDVLQILQHIAREAGTISAIEFAETFENMFDRLAAYPLAYPGRPSLGADVRMAPVPPYVILYRWEKIDHTVTVLRLLHGHRDITRDVLKAP